MKLTVIVDKVGGGTQGVVIISRVSHCERLWHSCYWDMTLQAAALKADIQGIAERPVGKTFKTCPQKVRGEMRRAARV